MNNQYQHFGRPLTPSIAQELILELYAGWTLQRQKIVRTVDEAHRERGGLPPNAKVHHPAEHALSKMKQLGLADNLERGLWFILGEQTQIKTLDDFTKWTKRFAPRGCVFRGLPNESYTIQASAYRRPKENERNFETFLEINKDLIDEVILRGYDEKNGRKLNHLEILAELQHFGAATCLIDFSYNAQVALWFACQRDSKASKDSENPTNGKVYAVFNHPPIFKKVTPDSIDKKIDEFLQDGRDAQSYHWQPRQQNNRIIAQQSVFLFGRYEFGAYDECVILVDRKQDILTELEQVSGITEATLFPDFEKFALLRGEGVPYIGLNKYDYLELAINQFRIGNYAESVLYYDRFLEQDTDYAEAYYQRGQAKFYSEQYKSAISDLDKFISTHPDYSTDFDYIQAYGYRGHSNLQLGNLDKAKADLETGILLAHKAKDWSVANELGQILDYVWERIKEGTENG